MPNRHRRYSKPWLTTKGCKDSTTSSNTLHVDFRLFLKYTESLVLV